MVKVTLTKRSYISKGNVHVFRNDKSGDLVYVQCTDEEYSRMGEKGGNIFYPKLHGHTWKQSVGGCDIFDTPSTRLGVNEYAETLDGKVVVNAGKMGEVLFEKSKIINDQIGETEIIWL